MTQAERKTILYLDHTAALGGGEIALLHLVRHLDRSRFDPVVVLSSPGPLQESLEQAGIETRLLPLDSGVVQVRKDTLQGRNLFHPQNLSRSIIYARRLADFCRERKVSLIHTNSLKSDIIGGIAARMAGLPVVWHVRDRIEEDYLPKPMVHLFRFLCRVEATWVIANSRCTLETLHLPPNKPASVVYSGVTLDAEEGFQVMEAKPPRETLLVGIVGRISPWKGQHIFIQAAARVRQQFPQARFQIIGSPLFGEEAYEAQIRAQVAELQLENAVEFLGFRKDVPQLLQQLDLLVHASTTGEPFGQVVVQGMAAGLPVVATDGGGIPEIVEPGVTGILVPMDNVEAMAAAVVQILECPDRGKAMGRAGRQRVEECFTVAQAARQVEQIYTQLLSVG